MSPNLKEYSFKAGPATGGLMTDAEVAQALSLLAQPAHI